MRIISFEEINQSSDSKDMLLLSAKYGKKSTSLIELTRHNFNVPGGWCLPVEAYSLFLSHNQIDPASFSDIAQEMSGENNLEKAVIEGEFPEILLDNITDFFVKHKDSYFAIRSSSATEDLEDASFAGIYKSYLNQKGLEQCLDSIKRCWASIFDIRVLQYCNDNGLDFNTLTMPVLIQTMIPAEKSGVAFSTNPLKGLDTEVYIEAVYGLGEVLVGGEATPDQFTYDWFADSDVHAVVNRQDVMLKAIPEPPFIRQETVESKQQQTAVLSNEEVKSLAHTVIDVQAAYGFLVDVEWVMYQDTLYIVQARPITNIQYSSLTRAWTTADFKDGGVSSAVCTAYMASLYHLAFSQSLSRYLESIYVKKASERECLIQTMFGRPYWNTSYVKEGLARLPGYKERKFDEDLGVKITYEGDGNSTGLSLGTLVQGLIVLWRIAKSRDECIATFHSFPDYQKKVFDVLDATDVRALSEKDFFDFFNTLVYKHYHFCETSYFRVIYDNSNQKTLFAESFEKLGAKINNDINFLKLLGGLTNLSHLQSNYDLWDISRKILQSAESSIYWREESCQQLREDFEKDKLKYHTNEIKSYISKYRHLSTRQLDISVENLDENPEFIFNSLKHMLASDDNEDPRLLNKVQYQSYLDERNRLEQSLPFYKRRGILKKLDTVRDFLWHREEFRDYSTRMYDYLRRFTLVFGEHLVKKGVLAIPSEVFHLRHEELSAYTNGQLSADELKATYLLNKRYYRSFRHFNNSPDVGLNYGSLVQHSGKEKVYRGIACSAGVVQGIVKVVHSVEEIHRLEKGDILVTRFTDPGWTPVFGLLSAVLTETGGLLSHAAVISREYGIPAILAIDNITHTLKCGQEVVVDGNAGEVRVVDN